MGSKISKKRQLQEDLRFVREGLHHIKLSIEDKKLGLPRPARPVHVNTPEYKQLALERTGRRRAAKAAAVKAEELEALLHSIRDELHYFSFCLDRAFRETWGLIEKPPRD